MDIPDNPSNPNGFDPDFAAASDWAKLYRAAGLQVVPCKNKRPMLKAWKEYQNELVPQPQFDAWYGAQGAYVSHYDMGMLTGTASGRILMIDLDFYKAGGDAAKQWWGGVLMTHNNGMVLETWQQRTGGGGIQMFFTYPENWKFAVNAKTDINVDIRCQGGFAVLPPTLHASGSNYVWEAGLAPWEIEILAAPDWLLEEVEKLVLAHGHVSRETYGQNPPQNGGGSVHTGGQYDAFGHLTDDRETFMRDLVWGAVVDWYRECPIKPGEGEIRAKAGDKYLIYERDVAPRAWDPTKSKSDLLDMEGRGRAEFWVKWTYAMGLWETKVAADAQKPGKSKGEYSSKREGFFHKDPDFGGGSAYNDQTDEFKADPNFVDPSSPPQPIEWLDMSNWDNVPVPTRKWAIRDRVPLNQVGLFSGEGGTGKSIIELMKNVAHVVGGADWLGSVPEQGPAFYLGAEDEADEIHIRLDAIARHYKTNFKELTARGLKVLPLLGQDSMLCVQAGRGNHIETTPLYRQLLQAAGDLKPKNISIDTLSRAFGGDEINRVQVYAFAMYMQAVAKAAQGSVTILSHPSLAGMASGSGISGSTAWHGAFRFRQYLKGIKQEDDADPTDDDLRQLEFKKNQYGPPERPIVLRYRDGLFVPLNGATDPERLTREACADGVFVNLLRRFNTRGDDVSHQPRSHYFAPHLFADELAAKEHKLRKVELRDAMQRLMASNRVLVEMFRKNGRSQSRLVLSPGS